MYGDAIGCSQVDNTCNLFFFFFPEPLFYELFVVLKDGSYYPVPVQSAAFDPDTDREFVVRALRVNRVKDTRIECPTLLDKDVDCNERTAEDA